MWSGCGRDVVGMWSGCGRDVVGMWSECGRNVVGSGHKREAKPSQALTASLRLTVSLCRLDSQA